MTVPTFERLASATLQRVTDTFKERGEQYGDTWADCQWLTLDAVALKLGYSIASEHWRAIAAAAMVDIKHQRMQGGFKDDSLVDGIAYAALLTEEMRQIDNATTA